MGKHLETIMKKMFDEVGETFTPEYVKQEHWYLKHSWTTEQHNKFFQWMYNYLRTSRAVEKELYTYISPSAQIRKQRVGMFLLSYGWRIDDGKEINYDGKRS